jgi:hypothetical protein
MHSIKPVRQIEPLLPREPTEQAENDFEEFNLVSGTWKNVKPQIEDIGISEREPTEQAEKDYSLAIKISSSFMTFTFTFEIAWGTLQMSVC